MRTQAGSRGLLFPKPLRTPISTPSRSAAPKLATPTPTDSKLEPPMPEFRVAPAEEVDIRSKQVWPWILKYVQWVSTVLPTATMSEISQQILCVVRFIVQVHRSFDTVIYASLVRPLFTQVPDARNTLESVCKDHKMEKKAVEKAREAGREICMANQHDASEHRDDLAKWNKTTVYNVNLEMKRHVCRVSDSDFEVVEDTPLRSVVVGGARSASPTMPLPPPPSRLLRDFGPSRLVPTDETRNWMQECYRWNLPRENRFRLEELSQEISNATNGVVKPHSFRNYRKVHPDLFKRIEAEVGKEIGRNVTHVGGWPKPSQRRGSRGRAMKTRTQRKKRQRAKKQMQTQRKKRRGKESKRTRSGKNANHVPSGVESGNDAVVESLCPP
ncbi:hypothetical protein EXIGLDRAFT_70136 [Exidia glandulosa HHB12029]|uniref:Uncharacterized protein n=1 Tax=Exidia glandulosa HHB12029 TaxID=1314781 RepID=A0A165HZK8_EXIGL|nr:hypothetical protein EXIGLDRAFT_70136 [Exidia glandulosa HHB12029]